MVSKIRELCKKNKTTIAALERQLGFGNGVISRWDKSIPNYERLRAVADALGVAVSDLTDDGEGIKKDLPQGEAVELTDLQKKAWAFILGLNDENLKKFIAVGEAMLGE